MGEDETFALLPDLTQKSVRDKLMDEAEDAARRSYSQRQRALKRRREERVHASA